MGFQPGPTSLRRYARYVVITDVVISDIHCRQENISSHVPRVNIVAFWTQ